MVFNFLASASLISCPKLISEGLVKAVTIVMIFHGVQGIDFLANIGMAFRFGFR